MDPSFNSLPYEISSLIFTFLTPDSAQIFSIASKYCNKLSTDSTNRAILFLKYYGKGQALYKTYTYHRSILDVTITSIMLKNGALFPRFLAQLSVQDFQSKTHNPPSTPLYVFFVNQAFNSYKELANFKLNDHREFERLVRVPNPNSKENIEKLKTLITKFGFFPTLDQSHRIVAESLYLLGNIDLVLISDLQRYTGLDITEFQEGVMDRVLEHAMSTKYVQNFLDVGFNLTDRTIKKGIAGARPIVFSILANLVSKTKLKVLAEDTIYELFGPYLNRMESLNISWDSTAVQRIIHHFNISDEAIERALLDDPSKTCTYTKVHPNFPVTRPYLKSRPYFIWSWILDTFGPHHRLSIACFDDALSRAVADQTLHDLLDNFLEQGMVLRPRHVKILACRVLHRNMTSNALQIFIHLKKQLQERRRLATSKFSSSFDEITQVHEPELQGFLEALNRDMLLNDDWKTKSSTIQLGGGINGGTYQISRTPTDVLRFIDVGKAIVQDLESWGITCRENLPKNAVDDVTVFNRIKTYCISNNSWFKNSSVSPM
ncbi:hypothetical protein HK103_003460 [Boothiomyces macroporosus]|uniref:F-box domain-containing protein n=1 Tax=Boothiomyces macroporosus TaxID=261099 RepID=A0AAD5Y4N4_9FUNG|nr:hypothetical protein HK103_003460 [Boothiomyces macroporosus]